MYSLSPRCQKTKIKKICGKYLNKRGLNHLETTKKGVTLEPFYGENWVLIFDTL